MKWKTFNPEATKTWPEPYRLCFVKSAALHPEDMAIASIDDEGVWMFHQSEVLLSEAELEGLEWQYVQFPKD